MEYNERKDLRSKKEKEISDVLSSCFASPDHLMTELEEIRAITVTSPMEPKPMMSFMTTNSLGNTSSIKPGNIRLNIANLIFSIPAAITAGFGVKEDNLVLKVSAFLLVWKELKDCMTIVIEEDEANVMIALWRNCNKRHEIGVSDGLTVVNKYLSDKHKSNMDNYNYQKTLDKLIAIKSIEITNDVIWLREWISKSYGV